MTKVDDRTYDFKVNSFTPVSKHYAKGSHVAFYARTLRQPCGQQREFDPHPAGKPDAEHVVGMAVLNNASDRPFVGQLPGSRRCPAVSFRLRGRHLHAQDQPRRSGQGQYRPARRGRLHEHPLLCFPGREGGGENALCESEGLESAQLRSRAAARAPAHFRRGRTALRRRSASRRSSRRASS